MVMLFFVPALMVPSRGKHNCRNLLETVVGPCLIIRSVGGGSVMCNIWCCQSVFGCAQIKEAPYGIALALGIISFASVYEYGEKQYRSDSTQEKPLERLERYIGRAAMVVMSCYFAQQYLGLPWTPASDVRVPGAFALL
jgi:hypothetical protein